MKSQRAVCMIRLPQDGASTTHLGNHGSFLDTKGRGTEQLRLGIRSAVRPGGHPVHLRETRHGGQVVCRSSKEENESPRGCNQRGQWCLDDRSMGYVNVLSMNEYDQSLLKRIAKRMFYCGVAAYVWVEANCCYTRTNAV